MRRWMRWAGGLPLVVLSLVPGIGLAQSSAADRYAPPASAPKGGQGQPSAADRYAAPASGPAQSAVAARYAAQAPPGTPGVPPRPWQTDQFRLRMDIAYNTFVLGEASSGLGDLSVDVGGEFGWRSAESPWTWLVRFDGLITAYDDGPAGQLTQYALGAGLRWANRGYYENTFGGLSTWGLFATAYAQGALSGDQTCISADFDGDGVDETECSELSGVGLGLWLSAEAGVLFPFGMTASVRYLQQFGARIPGDVAGSLQFTLGLDAGFLRPG